MNLTVSNDNLKRVGLHLLFAAAGAVLVALPQLIGSFHLPPSIDALVVALATSAASFVRKEDAAVDAAPPVPPARSAG